MTALHLPRTSATPEVEFRPADRLLLIRGECYPENPLPFFGQLQAALQRALDGEAGDGLDVAIRLSYLNSASTKGFRKLLDRLDLAAQGGVPVRVAWEHEASDDTMAELGRDLVQDLHFLDFEPRPFEASAA